MTKAKAKAKGTLIVHRNGTGLWMAFEEPAKELTEAETEKMLHRHCPEFCLWQSDFEVVEFSI